MPYGVKYDTIKTISAKSTTTTILIFMKRQLLLICFAAIAIAGFPTPSSLNRPQPLGPNVKHWLTAKETSTTSGDKLNKYLYIYDKDGMPLREERYNWNKETSKYELTWSKECKWTANSYEEIEVSAGSISTKTLIEEDPDAGISIEYKWTRKADETDWKEDSKYVYRLAPEGYFYITESWYPNEATGSMYLISDVSYTRDSRGRSTKEVSTSYDKEGKITYQRSVERTYEDNDCPYPTVEISSTTANSAEGNFELIPFSKSVCTYEYYPVMEDINVIPWQTTSRNYYLYVPDLKEYRIQEKEISSYTFPEANIFIHNIKNEYYVYDKEGELIRTDTKDNTYKFELVTTSYEGVQYKTNQKLSDDCYSSEDGVETWFKSEFTYSEAFPTQKTRYFSSRTENSPNYSEPRVEEKEETWEYSDMGEWTDYLEKFRRSYDMSDFEWHNSYHSVAEYHPGSTAITRMISYKWSESDKDWRIDYLSDSFDGWQVRDWDFDIPSDQVRLYMYNGDVRTAAPFLLKSAITTIDPVMGGYFFSPTAINYTYDQNLGGVSSTAADDGITLWPRAVEDTLHIRIADGSEVNADVYSMNGVKMMTIHGEEAGRPASISSMSTASLSESLKDSR